MKKSLAICLSILILCVLPFSVSAHAGRTDGSGGHRDSDTGDYHYHHGYPEHDHYDMDSDGDLDCPYNFDDQTGANSGSQSGSSHSYVDHSSDKIHDYSDDRTYSPSTPPATITSSTNLKSNENDTFQLSGSEILYSLALLGIMIMISPAFIIAYMLALGILFYPCYWIWKLFRRAKDQEPNYVAAFIAANFILCALIYYFFLSSVVERLMSSPEMLAAALIIAGLAIFYAICLWYFSSVDDKTQISSLRKNNANLHDEIDKLQASVSEAEQYNAKLNQEITALKEQQAITITKLEKENAELWMTIENLQSKTSHPVAQADGLVATLVSEGVCLINGRTPAKGKITDRKPFGDYTAYVADRGRCYHSDPYCSSGCMRTVHIFKIYGEKPPCLKCGRTLPGGLPKWYTDNKDRFSL